MWNVSVFQLGGSATLTRPDDPRHALHENGGLADLWYIDDGDILCHPPDLGFVLLGMNFMRPTPKLEQGEIRRRQKSSTTSQTWTQPHPNGKLTRCDCMPVSTVAAGSNTLGVAVGHWEQHTLGDSVGPPSVHRVAKADVIRAMRDRVQLCQDPKVLVLAVSTTSFGCVATRSCKRDVPAEIFDEVGRRSDWQVFLWDSRRTVRNRRH